MMTTITLVFALLACSGAETVETPPHGDVATEPAPIEGTAAQTQAPEKARKAAEIANAIAKEPARTDAILQEHGTTRAEFEAMLYDIAEDPALAEAYATARTGS